MEKEKHLMTTGFEKMSDGKFISVFLIHNFDGEVLYKLRSKKNNLRVRAIEAKNLKVKSLINDKSFSYEIL